ISSVIGNAIRPNFAPGVDIDKLHEMSVSEIRKNILASGSGVPDLYFRALTTNGGPTITSPTGNVPRNFLRSHSLASIDLNIAKKINIAEGRTLQFRADMFNMPNHRNFGIPNGAANVTAFNFLNEAATDGGNRRIFVSLRYAF